jgi:hypothetical protein
MAVIVVRNKQNKLYRKVKNDATIIQDVLLLVRQEIENGKKKKCYYVRLVFVAC